MANPKKAVKEVPPDSASLSQLDINKEAVASPLGANNEIVAAEIGEIKAACRRAGLSIDDYVNAIKRAIVATKITVDKYGEEHVEDDHTAQLKGALMGLELEGYIKNKAVTQDNRKYTQVIYKWGGE